MGTAERGKKKLNRFNKKELPVQRIEKDYSAPFKKGFSGSFVE